MFDVIFPPKGTLITPEWPAATNARSFVLLRCIGLLAGVVAQAATGRMPADQETIRYTGFYGTDRNGKSFLSREVLGRRLRRPLLRRRQRRHPHRARLAQSAGRIHRDAVSAPGREARACAPIPAAPASAAAASAMTSIIARWSIAAPSSPPTACGSAAMASMAARPALPFCVTIDAEGAPRDLGGLVDGEPVLRRADRARGHHRRRRLGRSARA